MFLAHLPTINPREFTWQSLLTGFSVNTGPTWEPEKSLTINIGFFGIVKGYKFEFGWIQSYKQWIFLVEPDITEIDKTHYQQHKKRWKQETTGGAIIRRSTHLCYFCHRAYMIKQVIIYSSYPFIVFLLVFLPFEAAVLLTKTAGLRRPTNTMIIATMIRNRTIIMPTTTRMLPLKTAWKGLLFTSHQILWVSQFIAFVDSNIYLTLWVIISHMHLVYNFDTWKHRTGMIMPTTIRPWSSLTILPTFLSFILQDVDMQRPVKQCFDPQQRKSDLRSLIGIFVP